MAKVYLDAGDNFVLSSAATVYGSTGTEKLVINSGVTGVIADANVERVDLAGASTGYTFQQAGNQLKVFSGTSLVATIPVQDDANGTQVVFSNGSVEVKVGTTGMTLGGATVPSTAAAAVTPTTIDSAVTSGAGSSTGTPTTGQAFSLTTGSTDAPVMTAGNDTVTGALGTIQDGDRLIDSSTLDNDVANLTLNVATAKPQIISVETLNVTGEYTTTGFDFTNAIGVKTANFAAGITGATVTASKVAAVRVAEIKAGANVGTLTVKSDDAGTGTAVKVDTGSATTITIGGDTVNTGNDIYDITLGAAATSLTLEANGGNTASTADAFTVKLVGNTLAFNADAGQIETLTLNSTGAANTLTLTGQLVEKAATTSKAVITGDKSLTIKGTLADVDGVKVEDSTTAGTTTFTTNAAIPAATYDLKKAAFDVVNLANSANAANTFTLNEATTLKLSAALGNNTTLQVDNAAGTLTTGVLSVDIAATQANAVITSTKVGTLKLSTASATTAVSVADIQANAATTAITLSGAKDLTVTKLTAAADDLVFSATGFTGKLNLTTDTANKFVIVGGEGNDTISFSGTADASTGSVAQGGAGNDTLTAGANAAVLSGGIGNDTITGAAGADTLDGGAGNDSIKGGAGADIITGGDGDDYLEGENGVDTMTGGAGADKFVISAGTTNGPDVITDFVAGSDKIAVSGTVTNAATVLVNLTSLSTTNQTAVDAEATVAAAAAKALTNAGSGYAAANNDVILFNYKSDVYAYINADTTAAVDATNDFLVKITGVTGTVTAADFLVS